MGMAQTKTYPVPEVRKSGKHGLWRVTWAAMNNSVWYREFFQWELAIQYATGDSNAGNGRVKSN